MLTTRYRHLYSLALTPRFFFSSQSKVTIEKEQPKLNRMILKNYKSQKTQEPQIIQIDGETKEAQLLTPLQSHSLGTLRHSVHEKVMRTFLPADYPHSVTKEYLPFSIYSNISSISITAMTFLSTQALFVALGG